MLTDFDVKILGQVPQSLIDDFAVELRKVQDWGHSDFTRYNDGIPSVMRTVIYPCGLRPEANQIESPQILAIREAFKPLRRWVASTIADRLLIKCDITYLFPKSIVPYHLDQNWFHEHSIRIHVPIISNENCFWLSQNRQYPMTVGNYYEVNNRTKHTFWNNGDSGRVHVVMDLILPSEYNRAIAENIDVNISTIEPDVTDPKEFLDNLILCSPIVQQ